MQRQGEQGLSRHHSLLPPWISRRTVAYVSMILATLVVAALLLRLRAEANRAGAVPSPRPCTLGSVTNNAAPVGGIVALAVTSTYPNTVVIQRFAPPVPTATTTTMCVLRETDGALLAHFRLSQAGLTSTVTSLRIAPDGSAIYIAGEKAPRQGAVTGRICAVHPLTGAPLWCENFGTVPLHIMLVGSEMLVSSLRSLTALETKTGKTLWRNDNAPLYFDLLGLRQVDDLVVGVGNDDVAALDEVCAWSMRNGAQVWCTHSYQDVAVSSIDVDAGSHSVTMVMRFADSSGMVEQLNADSGAVLWSQRLPTGGIGRGNDTNGIVYITSYANCNPYDASAPCQTAILMFRATTGITTGHFLVDGNVNGFTVVGSAAITLTKQPSKIAAAPLPGTSKPLATFTYYFYGFSIGSVMASDQSAIYIGSGRIGVLSFTSGAPLWEADDCGSPLAGSATSSLRNGATIWCHWPLHSSIMAVAVQNELAQLQ